MLQSPVFEDGFVAAKAFDNLDALAAALPGWNMNFARLNGGDFSAKIEIASTSDLQLTRFVTSSGMLANGLIPRGVAGATLILSAPHGFRSRGRSISIATTSPARMRGGEINSMTFGPADKLTVLVNPDLLQRHVHSRFDRDAAKFGEDWMLRAPPGTPDFAERGRAVSVLLSVLSMRAVSQEARYRLQECVLQIILESLETDTAAQHVAPLSVRRRVAREAEAVLRARINDPPSLRELCEALKVPERTLHLAFQEGFGMPPKAYLRALRLSAAHQRLHCGKGPVTEVATDLGFFHFGRFATEYRAMFGEPPSETLRRARGFKAP